MKPPTPRLGYPHNDGEKRHHLKRGIWYKTEPAMLQGFGDSKTRRHATCLTSRRGVCYLQTHRALPKKFRRSIDWHGIGAALMRSLRPISVQDSLIDPEEDGCGDADCGHESVGAAVIAGVKLR